MILCRNLDGFIARLCSTLSGETGSSDIDPSVPCILRVPQPACLNDMSKLPHDCHIAVLVTADRHREKMRTKQATTCLNLLFDNRATH